MAGGDVGLGDRLGTGEDGTEVLLIGDVGTEETPTAAGAGIDSRGGCPIGLKGARIIGGRGWGAGGSGVGVTGGAGRPMDGKRNH